MNQKVYRPSDFSNQNLFAQYKEGSAAPKKKHTKSKNRNFSILTNNYTDTLCGAVLTTLSVKCKVQYVYPTGQKTKLSDKWLTFQSNGKLVVYKSSEHDPMDSTLNV